MMMRSPDIQKMFFVVSIIVLVVLFMQNVSALDKPTVLLISSYHPGFPAFFPQIIQGTLLNTILVVIESPNRDMFDFLEMQKVGIKKSDLPKTSLIINEPESVYTQHKNLIRSVVGILAILID